MNRTSSGFSLNFEASSPAIGSHATARAGKSPRPTAATKVPGSPRKSRRATSRLRVHRWPSPSGPAGETWPGENTSQARPRLPQAHQQQLCSRHVPVLLGHFGCRSSRTDSRGRADDRCRCARRQGACGELLQDEDAPGCRSSRTDSPAGRTMCPSSRSLRRIRLRAAAEQHAVRQDDRHHTVILEVVKPVQQEREVSRRLRGQPVVLEAHVLA